MVTIRKACAWFKSFKNRVKNFFHKSQSYFKKRRKKADNCVGTKAPSASEISTDSTKIKYTESPEIKSPGVSQAAELSTKTAATKPSQPHVGANSSPTSSQPKAKSRVPGQGDFQDFYKKWARFHGPSLTLMDKKFLESLGEEFFEFEENAWKVLASPYLKAIYNGLESIREIDDLLVLDQKAKDRIKPFILNCIEGRPESIDRVIGLVHDKVTFETRYGRKRLSLDPRIVPLWLGIPA